jgi:hypothetical protein
VCGEGKEREREGIAEWRWRKMGREVRDEAEERAQRY